MTDKDRKSCIRTIELLRRLAYNIHGVMDVIDADNCDKIIAMLEQEPSYNSIKTELNDCISRKETIDWLKRVTVTEGITFETGFKQILHDIEQMPSVKQEQYYKDLAESYEKTINKLTKAIAEQEPKQGHWEWVRYDGNCGNWHCSECRTIIPFMPEETDNTPIYKWCPMCGRKMEE